MKIILVDDDNEDVELFCEAIKTIDNSIDIIACDTCKQCIEMLQRTQPDIIFLDINMPEIDGRDCLLLLRDTIKADNIPIVMYSGYIKPNDVKLIEALNASYLIKPASFELLVDNLKVYIQ
jgi:CheY-like chemotaxis protein